MLTDSFKNLADNFEEYQSRLPRDFGFFPSLYLRNLDRIFTFQMSEGRGPGPLPPRWLHCPRKSDVLVANRFYIAHYVFPGLFYRMSCSIAC